MGNWKRVCTKAPAWAKYWRNHLMEKLLYVLFLMRCNVSNVLLHSLNHNNFLDNLDNGKDLDDIDFEELNKIGKDWAARGSVEAISGPSED